jgi:hypothetical protein
MANKYSRYELQPFPSLYVNDRLPEVTQLLRQRYDQNKTSKDLIDRTLAQIEVMDGDTHHIERVKTRVKSMLQDHISQGDWENSSLVVSDAAQIVETDQGLLASNRSMQNRQAEIKAIREARLNGIPMIDWGAASRESHQSYVYDPESETYVTNIYEPMASKQLDYRTRKQTMVGKIPADAGINWSGIGRGKTNKIANLLIDQYITDTPEGKQEFEKLVKLDLPQDLPIDERTKMAKAQILQDFKEIAQQQEFNQVTATKTAPGSGGALPPGISMTGSNSTPISYFANADDKVNKLNEDNMAYFAQLKVGIDPISGQPYTDADKQIIKNQIIANNKLLDAQINSIAKANGQEGANALVKYNRIKDKFTKYKDDGEYLWAATQFLTYRDASADTDWMNVIGLTAASAGAGAGTGAAVGSTGFSMGPLGVATTAGGALVGTGIGGVTGFGTAMYDDWYKPRGVRDWARRQEPLISSWIGDSERDQLKEEIWGNEDLKDVDVDFVNKRFGTNFSQSDVNELWSATNAYYTFMTKNTMQDANGNQISRLSGDDLMEKVTQKQWILNQPKVGFDTTEEGNDKRTKLKEYITNDFSLVNSGITFDHMLPGSSELNNWLEEGFNGKGGVEHLQLDNVLFADPVTNTPMRLQFGFEGDGTDQTTRFATITDPTVLQPGGWVNKLLTDTYNMPEEAFNEIMRRDFDERGYANVPVADYINQTAQAKSHYFGGGTAEEAAQHQQEMEKALVIDLLLNPTLTWPQYTNNLGQRGVNGSTGFVPFIDPRTGTFNQATWTILQQNPNSLAKIKQRVLNMSMQEFSGLQF